MKKFENVPGKDEKFLLAFKSDLLEFIGICQKGRKSKSTKIRNDE